MNIILNGQTLQCPLTGIGYYTRYLLEGLKKNELINQIICIPNIKTSYQNTEKNYFIKKNIKKFIKFLPYTYSVLHTFRNANFYNKTHFLVKENYIYHEPCYILKPYLGPKVCTIHDLSHIRYPEYHPKERISFLNRYLNIYNANQIITPSNFIKNEIINIFDISPNKISTVYHGVSKIFKPRKFNEIKHFLMRYNLHDKSYLLSVGTLEPRKNLVRLLQAFRQLPDQQRRKYPLVLVGTKGWNISRFEKLIHPLIKKEQLYCLGYIPEVDLPYLYSGAYGFIYLSVYEGFGLPLLEAMASGIPTLASSVSAMPEIVGNAAILANPFDLDLIAVKLNQLTDDLTLRKTLKKMGPLQADKFSWDSCIENTIAVYRRTLNSLGVS